MIDFPDDAILTLFVRILCFFSLACAAEWTIRRCRGSAALVHVTWLGFLLSMGFLAVAAFGLQPIILPILPALPVTLPLSGFASQAVTADSGGTNLLLIVFLWGAALLLARLLHSRWTLWRLWSAATQADGRIVTLAEDARQTLHVRCFVELRVSSQSIVPMTWGAGRILLPAAALGWNNARLRMILLHETAHIVRGDSRTVLLASIVSALFWMHPCAWMALRRMKLAQEQAADDMVIQAGIMPEHYCNNLLEIAASLSRGSAPLAAVASHGGSSLENRFRSALTARNRAPLNRLALTGALFAAIATAFFVGTLTLGHAQAPAPNIVAQVPLPRAPLPPRVVTPQPAPARPRVTPPANRATVLRTPAMPESRDAARQQAARQAQFAREQAQYAQETSAEARRQQVEAGRQAQMARDEARRLESPPYGYRGTPDNPLPPLTR